MARYTGGIIRKEGILPTSGSASGIWSLSDHARFVKAATWPGIILPSLYPFTNATFTHTQFGRTGPDLTTARNGLTGTGVDVWKNNTAYFNTSSGIQLWTVPLTGTYRIQAVGGSGGIHGGSYFPGFPGAGAAVLADVSLTQGETIYIVVGQKPSSITTSSGNGAGGGGGTFLYTGAIGGAGLIMVAGGGGGTGHGSSGSTAGNGKGGSNTTNSNESFAEESFGINPRTGGGSAGNLGISLGGRVSSVSSYGWGGGGTGWAGDGQNTSNNTGQGGTRFIGGLSDDGEEMAGGFGGGGGAGGNGNSGGGGGGYTGGGGGAGWNNVRFGGGGGAGSFVISGATNITMTLGASGINYGNTTNGRVEITKL